MSQLSLFRMYTSRIDICIDPTGGTNSEGKTLARINQSRFGLGLISEVARNNEDEQHHPKAEQLVHGVLPPTSVPYHGTCTIADVMISKARREALRLDQRCVPTRHFKLTQSQPASPFLEITRSSGDERVAPPDGKRVQCKPRGFTYVSRSLRIRYTSDLSRDVNHSTTVLIV